MLIKITTIRYNIIVMLLFLLMIAAGLEFYITYKDDKCMVVALPNITRILSPYSNYISNY